MKFLILHKIVTLGITFLILSPFNFSAQTVENLKYLGQKPPKIQPELFAPDIISKKNKSLFGSVFNKGGTEFYYGVDVNGKSEIWFTKLENKEWTKPETLLSLNHYNANDPFLSNDENQLYFISNKANLSDTISDSYNIWYIERDGKDWNLEIFKVDTTVNSDRNEYYMSFTLDGSMYFSSNVDAPPDSQHNFNIYKSKYKNGAFLKSIPMDESINTKDYEADVFIAPDESYIIFCSIRKEGYGQGDLYISFKNDDGNWTKAKNMGEIINTEGHELCPFITKDGKYFFYTSNKKIYWVDSKIINSLKD